MNAHDPFAPSLLCDFARSLVAARGCRALGPDQGVRITFSASFDLRQAEGITPEPVRASEKDPMVQTVTHDIAFSGSGEAVLVPVRDEEPSGYPCEGCPMLAPAVTVTDDPDGGHTFNFDFGGGDQVVDQAGDHQALGDELHEGLDDTIDEGLDEDDDDELPERPALRAVGDERPADSI